MSFPAICRSGFQTRPYGVGIELKDNRPERSNGIRRNLQYFNFGVVTGGAGEPAVARDQRRFQQFGERDIDSVVGREIVAQIPNPGQQVYVRIALNREIGEVG